MIAPYPLKTLSTEEIAAPLGLDHHEEEKVWWWRFDDGSFLSDGISCSFFADSDLGAAALERLAKNCEAFSAFGGGLVRLSFSERRAAFNENRLRVPDAMYGDGFKNILTGQVIPL